MQVAKIRIRMYVRLNTTLFYMRFLHENIAYLSSTTFWYGTPFEIRC